LNFRSHTLARARSRHTRRGRGPLGRAPCPSPGARSSCTIRRQPNLRDSRVVRDSRNGSSREACALRFFQQCFEVVLGPNMRRELAAELGPTVLAPARADAGARSRRFGVSVPVASPRLGSSTSGTRAEVCLYGSQYRFVALDSLSMFFRTTKTRDETVAAATPDEGA